MKQKQSNQNDLIKKFTDGFIICLALFALFIFAYVTVFFLKHWTHLYNIPMTWDETMYMVGILIAFASGIIYFIELFIHTFAESFMSLFYIKVKRRSQ